MSVHKLPAVSFKEETHSDSESSSSSSDDDQTWDDWVSDSQKSPPCRSLFDESSYPSATEALEHDKATHGVDLLHIFKTLGLDFHGRVRLVNYIRKQKPPPDDVAKLTGKEEFLTQDEYLIPIVENDPLIQLDVGDDEWSDDEDGGAPSGTPSGPDAAERRIRQLEKKLAQAKQDLAEYRKLVETKIDFTRLTTDSPDPEKGTARDDDTHYFDSYGENDIHAVMIQDKVRTSTYASFILSNPALFIDAVVLDVGCGTGILSLFAARAGAKRVIAVDASDVADKAAAIVKANKLENVITVIRGKVEEIKLPDDITHVDIIISEWMGYALLYESMLDSVLHARDRFLKPEGGVMVPSQCKMMLGLTQATDIFKERIEFWSDVYGFDMSAMASEVYTDAIMDIVKPETMVGDSVPIKDVPLKSITTRQLDFSSPFTLQVTAYPRKTVHAFVLYFDTFFTTDGESVPPETEVRIIHDSGSVGEVWRVGGEGRKRRSYSQSGIKKAVSFSTGPLSVPTHWKQCLLVLKEPFEVNEGYIVSGTFYCKKSSENSRELNVEIHYSVQANAETPPGEVTVQTFEVR